MTTPLYVINALAEVRDGGLTDMEDRDAAEMLVTDQRAAEWLNKCSDSQYAEALQDMEAASSDDFLTAEMDLGSEDDDDETTALPDDRNFGW